MKKPVINGFQLPAVYVDSHGRKTNGKYTIGQPDMDKHKTGSLVPAKGKKFGKSQFLWRIDAETAVLDAAAYADEYHLWGLGSSPADTAKVTVTNGYIGVTGKDGKLTNIINLYRKKPNKRTQKVHGCPGN